MRTARWIFGVSAIYGFLVLIPQYFLERQYGIDNPPAINHPEFFYGFIGVALAFQIVFALIAYDPIRYRPIMLAGVAEKFSFGIAAVALFSSGRLSGSLIWAAMIDIALGILFVVAFILTRRRQDV